MTKPRRRKGESPTSNNGHIGLSNEKVKEIQNGDFILALAFLQESQSRSHFVVHAYSRTFNHSPYLSRANVPKGRRRKNFLERLGFEYYESCNILGGSCYYKIIEEVPELISDSDVSQQLRVYTIHRRFEDLANRFGELYDKMREVDEILFKAGFELPWQEEELNPVIHKRGEKVYDKGQIYDFYRDILDITQQAKNEVFLIDAYVDEDALNLYLEKISKEARIRILTNRPQGNFLTVANKFKAKPNVRFEVRQNKNCHDRLFFIDNGCWVFGQSVRHAGEKPTFLVKIESYDIFRTVFERLWEESSILV